MSIEEEDDDFECDTRAVKMKKEKIYMCREILYWKQNINIHQQKNVNLLHILVSISISIIARQIHVSISTTIIPQQQKYTSTSPTIDHIENANKIL